MNMYAEQGSRCIILYNSMFWECNFTVLKLSNFFNVAIVCHFEHHIFHLFLEVVANFI